MGAIVGGGWKPPQTWTARNDAVGDDDADDVDAGDDAGDGPAAAGRVFGDVEEGREGARTLLFGPVEEQQQLLAQASPGSWGHFP